MKHTVKKILRKLIPDQKPDFIIAGAQKAGTSSLHYYLRQHPQLIGSWPKEVHFFDRDDNYKKGENWYHQAFKDPGQILKRGLHFEATPLYLYRSYAAERMHLYNPELKIIIILREPIKRAYSAWSMYKEFFETKNDTYQRILKNYEKNDISQSVEELLLQPIFPAFEEVIAKDIERHHTSSPIEEPSFVRRGLYLEQIRRFHDLFGKEKILILGFQDLVQNKKATLNQILAFLELELWHWNHIKDEKRNVRKYKEVIQPETEEILREFYQPHNEALFHYLGKTLHW